MRKDIEVPALPIFLEQIVSLSEKGNKPVSAEQYIAVKNPELARKLEIPLSQPTQEPVKDISELTEEDIKRLLEITVNLNPDRHIESITEFPDKAYSYQDVLEHIRQGTPDGNRFINRRRNNLSFVDTLIKEGRIRKPTEEDLLPLAEQIKRRRSRRFR